MATEPSLPILPPPVSGLSSLASKRKGTYADDPATSSDPPLFSSDDHLEAGITDNGLSGPRKRQYRGRWWDVRASSDASGARTKREFKRTADSGVWMPSEDLESEIALSVQIPEPVATHESANVRGSVDSGIVEDDRLGPLESPAAFTYQATEPTEDDSDDRRVERIIQDCLERSNERVDLSGMDLEYVSDAVLQPLRYMTRDARLDEQAARHGVYKSLIPSIKLFLWHNRLRAIPSAIFSLENLTVLSLRDNKLTAIPPAIGRLKRLKELNVSGNRLRYLPFEILQLSIDGNLDLLHIFPNPLLEPPTEAETEVSSGGGDDDDSSQGTVWVRESASLSALGGTVTGGGGGGLGSLGMASFSSLGRGPMRHSISAVTYFGVDGARLAAPPSGHERSTGNAPSLVELCLRSLSASPYAIDLSELSCHDWPDTLARLMHEMNALRAAGGQRCSVCGRAFVSARVEWVEWWYCLPRYTPCIKVGGPKPFLRRGCSWNCVPL